MGRHDDKYRQLGINISRYRQFRGMSQEVLAQAVHISRGHLSHTEAPNRVAAFSVATLFDIAEALEVDPKQRLNDIRFRVYPCDAERLLSEE